MSRFASFNSLAEAELSEAVTYYELESSRLGAALLEIVEQAVAGLLEYPESGPVLRGSYRKRVLRRFPFSLIYRINGEEVRILAVAHHRRRPFYWSSRG